MEARLLTYKNTIDVGPPFTRLFKCLYLGHQIIERKFSSLAEPHKRSPQGTHQRDSRYIFPITDAGY